MMGISTTYQAPNRNTNVTDIFLRFVICSRQIVGIGVRSIAKLMNALMNAEARYYGMRLKQ
jgi:hypothetical protein